MDFGKGGERRRDLAGERVVREVQGGELGEVGYKRGERTRVSGGVEGDLSDAGGVRRAGEAADEGGPARERARINGEVPGS